MQQQINLYQPDDTSSSELFSTMTMLIVIIITLVLMVSFYAVLLWKKEQLQSDINELRVQSEQTRVIVEKLEQTVAKLTDSKKKKEQLAYLKKVYTSKQRALDELSSMVSGNSEGLSSYFAALARKNMQTIWFNKINVYSGGREILLEGQSTDARSLPVLVSSLKDEPAFQGVNFRLFKAQRDEERDKKQAVLNFILKTETAVSENVQNP